MESNAIESRERGAFFGIFLVTWAYLWLRAFYVPLSHDEVATFFHYIQTGDMIPYTGALWDANNHLLNSLLSYPFYQLFGASEWALRMPSLLIAPLYFLFNYRIAQRIRNGWPRWSFLIVVLTTHYVVEHLAYCRGYGISLALLAGGIHYSMKMGGSSSLSLRDLILAVLCSVLALSANLTLLYSVLILFAFLIFRSLERYEDLSIHRKLQVGGIFLLGILLVGAGVRYLFDLKSKGALYLGEGKGFFEASVGSLAKAFFHSDGGLATGFLILLTILALVLFLFSLFEGSESGSKFRVQPGDLFSYLFFGNLIATLSAHLLLGVNYPEDRAFMYMFPFLVGSICFGADRVEGIFLGRVAPYVSLLLLLFPLRSYAMLNLTHQTYYAFRLQRIPERFIHKIEEESRDTAYKPTVAGARLRHFVYAYHNYMNGGELNPFYHKDYPAPNADFQIVDTSRTPSLKGAYKVLDHDPITDFSLLNRKPPLERDPLFTVEVDSTDGFTRREFNEFYNSKELLDSLIGDRIIVDQELTLSTKSEEAPFTADIVIEIRDEEGKKLYYDFLRCNWLRYSWDGSPDNFRYSLYVHEIPEGAERFKLYVWNKDGKAYRISSGEVRFARYRSPRSE